MAQTSDSQKQGQAAEFKKHYAQQKEYKKTAAAAYRNEQDRAKSESCPDAKTTYDIDQCLAKEAAKTLANYSTYVAGLRSEEGLPTPGESSSTGPTGRELTADERLKQFDGAEAAWHTYYVAQCSAAYDAYRGGTVAPSMELTCRIKLMRDRMDELEGIYEITSNR